MRVENDNIGSDNALIRDSGALYPDSAAHNRRRGDGDALPDPSGRRPHARGTGMLGRVEGIRPRGHKIAGHDVIGLRVFDPGGVLVLRGQAVRLACCGK